MYDCNLRNIKYLNFSKKIFNIFVFIRYILFEFYRIKYVRTRKQKISKQLNYTDLKIILKHSR